MTRPTPAIANLIFDRLSNNSLGLFVVGLEIKLGGEMNKLLPAAPASTVDDSANMSHAHMIQVPDFDFP